jgi:hypothetical protein
MNMGQILRNKTFQIFSWVIIIILAFYFYQYYPKKNCVLESFTYANNYYDKYNLGKLYWILGKRKKLKRKLDKKVRDKKKEYNKNASEYKNFKNSSRDIMRLNGEEEKHLISKNDELKKIIKKERERRRITHRSIKRNTLRLNKSRRTVVDTREIISDARKKLKYIQNLYHNKTRSDQNLAEVID